MRRELLLGAGNSRKKRITITGMSREWENLVTLDIDPSTQPHVVHDLNLLPLPFDDNMFDEIHAYEVLEHTGTQGDWIFFFNQFYEFWRVMKPGAVLCGTVPLPGSPWAWADPGHRRVLPRQTFYFLSQKLYEQEVGKTALTDYRAWWKGDFELVSFNDYEHMLGFVLKAIK